MLCGGQLAAQHLSVVWTRLQDMRRIEATLAKLLEQCRQGDEKVTSALFAALHADQIDGS